MGFSNFSSYLNYRYILFCLKLAICQIFLLILVRAALNLLSNFDPFEHAYAQPALRASGVAKPEQPFPPGQLGREDVLYGEQSNINGEENNPLLDDKATVRLKSLNQRDRSILNQWWTNQILAAGPQDNFSVLIGEESGTVRLGRRNNDENYGVV